MKRVESSNPGPGMILPDAWEVQILGVSEVRGLILKLKLEPLPHMEPTCYWYRNVQKCMAKNIYYLLKMPLTAATS